MALMERPITPPPRRRPPRRHSSRTSRWWWRAWNSLFTPSWSSFLPICIRGWCSCWHHCQISRLCKSSRCQDCCRCHSCVCLSHYHRSPSGHPDCHKKALCLYGHYRPRYHWCRRRRHCCLSSPSVIFIVVISIKVVIKVVVGAVVVLCYGCHRQMWVQLGIKTAGSG